MHTLDTKSRFCETVFYMTRGLDFALFSEKGVPKIEPPNHHIGDAGFESSFLEHKVGRISSSFQIIRFLESSKAFRIMAVLV